MINILNDLVLMVNDFIWTYILIAMLIILGVYFTVKTNFVQFRYFKEMVRLLGNSTSKDAKKDGKISSFQAFCISAASRVGTGNIAGIAIAVVAGGPGAIFWMWLIALIGSASGFVESTLAQIYKVKDGKSYRGGPAYYMEQGLNKKWMGITFSVLITICFAFIFYAVQANTITAAFNNAFNIPRFELGLVIAGVTAFVIFGGSNRIAKTAEFIVPVLAVLYIAVSLFVMAVNITEIPNIIKLIFTSALDFRSASMGTMGGMILVGVKRGLFSNEAGMGSAPNAAATAEVSHPVQQGLTQALGVFFDTLIICSCTAFVILLYPGYSTSAAKGIELTQEALAYHIGPLGNIFVAICILLFAYSSIIGNYYYGQSNIEFMSSKKTTMTIFRIVVIGFVLFGSVAQIDIVWNLADVFMGLMAIINLIAIALLGKYAFAALKDYQNQRRAGIENPTFNASSIKGLENIEAWGNEDKEEIIENI